MDNGHRDAVVKSIDSDIIVLAEGLFHELELLDTLYIEYGTSRSLQIFPIYEIVTHLGPIAKVLPIFHCISGCDTTSSPFHCGKTTTWNACDWVPQLTKTLVTIQNNTTEFKQDSVHME